MANADGRGRAVSASAVMNQACIQAWVPSVWVLAGGLPLPVPSTRGTGGWVAELQRLCHRKNRWKAGHLGSWAWALSLICCDVEQSSFFPGAQFSCHGNEQRLFLSTQLKKKGTCRDREILRWEIRHESNTSGVKQKQIILKETLAPLGSQRVSNS